jgi:hypothetical protein
VDEWHKTLRFVTSVTHDTSVTPMTCVTPCHNVTLWHKKVLKMQRRAKIYQLTIEKMWHFLTLWHVCDTESLQIQWHSQDGQRHRRGTYLFVWWNCFKMISIWLVMSLKGAFTRWDILWDIPWDIPWYSESPTEGPWDFSCKWRTFRGTYWVRWDIPWDVLWDIPSYKQAFSFTCESRALILPTPFKM